MISVDKKNKPVIGCRTGCGWYPWPVCLTPVRTSTYLSRMLGGTTSSFLTRIQEHFVSGFRKPFNNRVIGLLGLAALAPNRLTLPKILALILIWSLGTHVQAQSNESFDLFPLLSDDDPLLEKKIPPTEGVVVIQERHVLPDPNSINALFDTPIEELLAADGFAATLFDGKSYLMKVERRTELSATSTEVAGRLEGVENGSFNLIRHISGKLAATFALDGQQFRLVALPDEGYALIDIDESGYPSGGEPIPVVSPEDDTSGAIDENDGSAEVESDDGSVLDVLVVYTPAAKAQAPGGGTAADIETLIGLAISEANTGFSDSGIQLEFNLVHTEEIPYVESNASFSTDLFALRGTNDGAMDSVHALRDTHNADVVALIRKSGGSCGIAFRMTNLSLGFASSAFSVTSQSCAVGNYSFAHEIGHNLGSHHDRFVAGPPTLYPSSFGFTNDGSSSSSGSWRTIMAYSSACANGCTRINRWSNAQQNYNGDPIGVVSTDPAAADNALSINLSKYTASNWRTTAVGPPAITSPSNGSLISATETFSWDDNGVVASNWWLYLGSTLGARDIYDSGNIVGGTTSTSVSQISQTGNPVYARLWYQPFGGSWLYIDSTYDTIESTDTVPGQVTLVAPSGIISTTTPTYEWNAEAGATDYYLWVNDSTGTPIQTTYSAAAVGCSGGTGVCSITPSTAVTGSSVWWVLASNSAGNGPWSSPLNFTMQSSIPVITSHSSGQTLTDPNGSETFVWSGSSGLTYWLYVGSAQGGKQYHDSGDLSGATSEAVSVPTNGSTIWVRLWYRAGTTGSWSFIDEQFVAAGNGPSLDTPVPGSILSGPAETFSWSDTGGTVTEWWLYVGSTVGGNDYEDSGTLSTSTSFSTVNNNLPTGSVPVYVRLWYRVGTGNWQYIDETYTSSPSS